MKKLKTILLAFTFIFIFIFIGGFNVNAETIDEVISSKRVSLKIVPPQKEEDVYTMMDMFSSTFEGYHLENCNEKGTECDLYKNGNNGPGEKKLL